MNQQLLFATPEFKSGDKVIYSCRTQVPWLPYTIVGIREVKGYVEYKVNDLWWRAGNLKLWTKEVAAGFGL